MPEARAHDNGGGDDGDKPQGQRYIKRDIIEVAIFLQEHEGGDIRRPFADLQGQKRHHLRSVLTIANVEQTPIIGAFVEDQENAHEGAEGILVLPIPKLIPIAVNKKNSDGEKQDGQKMRKGKILKNLRFAITEKSFLVIFINEIIHTRLTSVFWILLYITPFSLICQLRFFAVFCAFSIEISKKYAKHLQYHFIYGKITELIKKTRASNAHKGTT